ncbi:MAG: cytochrome c [Campylobacterota bacterium]|nr:cytochrome c [Campylobacterota bacterium]
MKYIALFFFPLFLFGETSFITPMEYASQLYKNPRGIGCQHCHGEHGEGKLVAIYIDKKEKKRFGGPAINKIDFHKFYIELSKRKQGMPRYYLTIKEVKALYLYLHQNDANSPKERRISDAK